MHPPLSATELNSGSKKNQILLEQLKLLYANTNLAIGITILAAIVLGSLLSVIPRYVVFGWWLYMALVSAFRYVVAWRFRRASHDT